MVSTKRKNRPKTETIEEPANANSKNNESESIASSPMNQEDDDEPNRKQRSESYSTVTSKSSAASSTTPTAALNIEEAGSSRLFQPHRTLGLLTSSNKSSRTTSPSACLYTSQKGKFHLEPQGKSSDESFVTVPLGDRFQILNCSKLVPVLVSRALPPSAGHHRKDRGSSKSDKRTGDKKSYHESDGIDEEEMYQAISDSSLNATVVTHGPKLLGRAVSITLYSRTRPLVCLDAFSFAAKKKKSRWGIVDVVQLGKQRVEMHGEKEGKMENALLLAVVCARDDWHRADKTEKKSESEVEVVGKDSDESEGSDVSSDAHEEMTGSDSDSSEDDTDSSSVEDKDMPPSSDCYGRVLLVRIQRTTMEIVKTIDLNGIGSNFIPHVGIHPATYVNKMLLGGRPTASKSTNKLATSLLLVNVKSGKMIHSFNCLKNIPFNGKKGKGLDSDSGDIFSVTTLQQSPAVDTIAVGTSDGSVHLINTLHDVKLFTLHHKSKHSKLSKGMNAISSLSFRTDGNATGQGIAPLAVGCDDGSISVWDLTPVEDENGGPTRRTLLTEMDLVHYGGVSKLEYLPGEPLILSTGLVSNSILMHVFDAPDHSGRILRQRKGHTSPPTLLRYLHPGAGGGGILANASDGTDASSCQILSCGGSGDLSLRVFSSARSNLDKEYSQGAGLERKAKKFGKLGPEGRAELLLPEIIGLATSEARSRDWGDLVTIHKNHAMAYVWSNKRGAQYGPVLRQSQWNISAMKERPPRSANAASLAISACGNFALVGTIGGVIYKYNLQSGLPRGSFPKDAIAQTEEEERRRKRGLKFAGDVGRTMRMLEKNLMKGGVEAADIDQAEKDRATYLDVEAKRKFMIDKASHVDAVVGIAIDSLNKTVVTAGADSKLVLWNFLTHMPHKKSPIMLPSPATKMCHVRDSDLAAIAMNDFGIAVFDCSSLSIVRYFGGSRIGPNHSSKERITHTGLISDMGFGPDGRKLFSSSLDSSIRVWDVPTGVCVDWMTFSSPPTSLTLSPTGEFLATSHVGRLGISLWCDKSFFRMVHLDGSPTEPSKMNEPCPVAECEQEGASEAALHTFLASSVKKDVITAGDGSTSDEVVDDMPPIAKEVGLITLSGLPPAHWKNLFHLELVKERNKPTEAPQKPPQAPFFLQWRAGLDSGTADGIGQADAGMEASKQESDKASPDGWDAVWSDDDDENENNKSIKDTHDVQSSQNQDFGNQKKRRKVVHDRSHLAELLQSCSSNESYSVITQYLSKMGPSSIDVELSSLCYGSHDLDEGLPLLQLASTWLLEACKSHQSFEAVNAYLHRFLHVHGNVIAAIENGNKAGSEEWNDNNLHNLKLNQFKDTLSQLREEQRAASNRLQGKMQHTICLLRHLSRMV